MASPYEELLDILRGLASEQDFSIDEAIGEERAQNILEIAGGDPQSAAQLYWDDFLANQERQQQQQQQQQESDDSVVQENIQLNHHEEPEEPQQAAGNNHAPFEMNPDDPLPAALQLLENLEHDDDDDVEAHIHPGVEAIRRLADIAQNDHDIQNNGQVIRNALQQVLLNNNNQRNNNQLADQHVSVSDDEAGGIWKRASRDEDAESMNSAGNRQPKPPKRRKQENDDQDREPDIEIDGYISNDDWLWDTLEREKTQDKTPPSQTIWGTVDQDDQNEEQEGNLVADEEEEANYDKSLIPKPWLNAGFSLSLCHTGVALHAPTDEDIAHVRWKERAAGNNSSLIVVPPHHCRSITALTSIVTALIYAGVSPQGGEIGTTAETPFDKLSTDEKKRQYEGRLADALTSLLIIAATAARNRKGKALRGKFENERNDSKDKQSRQIVQRRLKLCRVCHWNPDSKTLPSGRDPPDLLHLSLTNIGDLKSYVLSNISNFMGTGGCVLFLETIMHIHGKGAIDRMVEKARKDAGLPPRESPLIACDCLDRFRERMSKNPSRKQKDEMIRTMDTSPRHTSCLSVELLSLILTGRVFATFEGWSTDPLGIGLLSDTARVGKGLSRPEKPVYIIHGPTSYSAVWLRDSSDTLQNFANSDAPCSIAKFRHWQSWYGEQVATDFRLTTAYSKHWEPPKTTSKMSASNDKAPARPRMLNILLERRLKSEAVAKRAREVEEPDSRIVFGEDEVEHFSVNEDDKKLYPENYQMWRYDIRLTSDLSEKVQAAGWLSYHRLSERKKILVEQRIGPALKRILWKRWPLARMDEIQPSSANPVV